MTRFLSVVDVSGDDLLVNVDSIVAIRTRWVDGANKDSQDGGSGEGSVIMLSDGTRILTNVETFDFYDLLCGLRKAVKDAEIVTLP